MLSLVQLSLQIYYDGDGTDPCSWMTDGRVWHPLTHCALTIPIDYSGYVKYHEQENLDVGVSQDIDMTAIQVFGMAKSVYEGYDAYYSVMHIAQEGSLRNMMLNMSFELNLDDSDVMNCETYNVAPFQNVFGSITNVSITGTIHIKTSANTPKTLVLSRFLGDSADSASFSGLSSNLKYTVNGVAVEADAQIGSLKIQLRNKLTGPGQVEVFVPPSADPFETTFSLFNRVLNSTVTYLICTTWNTRAHPNAFKDYYIGMLQRYIEMVYETKGLMRRYFKDDAAGVGKELELNQSRDDYILYVGETKTVRFKKGEYMVVCEAGELYDAVEQKCVPAFHKGNGCPQCRKRFLGMCIAECGRTYKTKGFENDDTEDLTCYPECPKWLGYMIESSQNYAVETCMKCPTSNPDAKMAGLDSCLLVCNNKTYAAMQGCYASAVSGLNCKKEFSSMESICFIPGLDECPSGEYLAYLPQEQASYASQYYTNCRLFPPPGMQQVDNSVVYKDGCVDSHLGQQQLNIYGQCNESAWINDTCIHPDLVNLTVKPVGERQERVGICRVGCVKGLVDSCYNCTDSCPEGYYPQPKSGRCNLCLSSYDGGVFWDPSKMPADGVGKATGCVERCEGANPFYVMNSSEGLDLADPYETCPAENRPTCTACPDAPYYQLKNVSIEMDGQIVTLELPFCLDRCSLVSEETFEGKTRCINSEIPDTNLSELTCPTNKPLYQPETKTCLAECPSPQIPYINGTNHSICKEECSNQACTVKETGECRLNFTYFVRVTEDIHGVTRTTYYCKENPTIAPNDPEDPSSPEDDENEDPEEEYYYEIDDDVDNPPGTVELVKNCAEKPGYKYYNDGKCLKECPEDYYLIENPDDPEAVMRCSPTCDNIVIVEKWAAQLCVKTCPPGRFLIGPLCVGECPAGTIVIGNQCVGRNKTPMWIWVVTGTAILLLILLIVLITFFVMRLRQKQKQAQRLLHGPENTTVYALNMNHVQRAKKRVPVKQQQ